MYNRKNVHQIAKGERLADNSEMFKRHTTMDRQIELHCAFPHAYYIIIHAIISGAVSASDLFTTPVCHLRNNCCYGT